MKPVAVEKAAEPRSGTERSFILVATLLCVVTVSLAALTNFGYQTLSAVRAYVHGEGRWSKGQKNAMQDLLLFAITRDEHSYAAFKEELKVPLGDYRARLALEEPEVALAAATEGLAAGGNDRKDIPDMIRLYRRFRHVSYMARAIRAWELGDAGIAELLAAGEQLHQSVLASGTITVADIAKLERINEQLTLNEIEFSSALSDASRWVRQVLGALTIIVTLVLIASGLFVSRLFLKRIHSTEAKVRDSERRLSALIQNSNDGVSIFDADRKLVFRSAAGDRIIGGTVLDGVELTHPDDRPTLYRAWTTALETPGKPSPCTLRIRVGTGWRVLECVFVNLIVDPAIGGVVCNFRDVTERKQIEAHLAAADRMSSVGALASGLAQEISAPLDAAVRNLDHLAEELRLVLGVKLLNELNQTRAGMVHVKDLVLGLQTFARGDAERSVPVDVRVVLDSASSVAANEVRQRAQLIKNYAPELPLVLGNEAKLGQAFFNLLINAVQAIEKGNPAANEIGISATVESGRVLVEVKDSGAGISREHRSQIFEPFFTTRPGDGGKGLGLFVSHNIVASHGGSLSFESEPGKGTIFRASFPAAPKLNAR